MDELEQLDFDRHFAPEPEPSAVNPNGMVLVEGEILDDMEIMASDPQAIAESITPYFPDNTKKTKYLSYRACGFAIREALKMVGVSQRTVMRWRATDPQFHHLDTLGYSDVKAKLADRYIELEFRRNYRLVLQLDYDVLTKAAWGDEMTTREERWLARVRQHYTPQQLEVLERILGEGGGGGEFDFTSFVLSLKRGGSELTLAATREGDSDA